MEIEFEKNTTTCFARQGCWERRLQLELEGVVPDTQEDIGRVLTVQASVLLKSKDTEAGRVTVGGEVQAVLLYITEGEDALAQVRLTRPFEVSFEQPELTQDSRSLLRLRLSNCQPRALNPRKVAVAAEVTALLCAYGESEAVLDWAPPESEAGALFVQPQEVEAVWARQIGEKSFAVSEQFSFPREDEPEELLAQRVGFHSLSCQQVGSRAILRGSVEIEAYALCGESRRPLRQVFTTPFSQIMEIGEEVMDRGLADVELTSAYVELVDSISGGKALDVEAHAVVQLLGCGVKPLRYTADAYHNRVPALCAYEELPLLTAVSESEEKLSGEEAVEIAEDCLELLCAFPGVISYTLADGSLSAAVQLDILYRTKSGGLSCVRRSLSLSKPLSSRPELVTQLRLSALELKAEGEKALCRAEIAVNCLNCQRGAVRAVSAVELREETPFAVEDFPSLTLVRVEGESLWELAKLYHSSVAAIADMNELGDAPLSGRLLMIPKQI